MQDVSSPNLTPVELAAKYISTSKVDDSACSLKGNKISHNSSNNSKRSMEQDENMNVQLRGVRELVKNRHKSHYNAFLVEPIKVNAPWSV